MSDETGTITIKFGDGFAAPWHVIRDTGTIEEMVATLNDYYGLDVDPEEDAALPRAIALASQVATRAFIQAGGSNGKSSYRGKPSAKTESGASKVSAKKAEPKAEPKEEKPKSEDIDLIAVIGKCTKMDQIQKVAAKYKAAIQSDDKIKEAMKAKVVEIKG